MKADAQAKFDAFDAAFAGIKATVTAAETLMDGLVAQHVTTAPTDPEVLAKIDALTAEVNTLKAELAAKVTADTPA